MEQQRSNKPSDQGAQSSKARQPQHRDSEVFDKRESRNIPPKKSQPSDDDEWEEET